MYLGIDLGTSAVTATGAADEAGLAKEAEAAEARLERTPLFLPYPYFAAFVQRRAITVP